MMKVISAKSFLSASLIVNFEQIIKFLIKAGIIEEMLEDTMEGLGDEEELEEEVQVEYQEVLFGMSFDHF